MKYDKEIAKALANMEMPIFEDDREARLHFQQLHNVWTAQRYLEHLRTLLQIRTGGKIQIKIEPNPHRMVHGPAWYYTLTSSQGSMTFLVSWGRPPFVKI